MKYTGFNDKNGNEINVGDRVRFLTIYHPSEEWDIYDYKGRYVLRNGIVIFRIEEVHDKCTKIFQ